MYIEFIIVKSGPFISDLMDQSFFFFFSLQGMSFPLLSSSRMGKRRKLGENSEAEELQVEELRSEEDKHHKVLR
jgi:hypothetical protein